MCTIVCMKQKTINDYHKLVTLAESLSFGPSKADRRIQVKMPSLVVEHLDKAFPNQDRSRVLTQLALEAILRHIRFPEPEIRELVEQEQHDLDRMWEYLEERDNEL